MHYTWKYVLQKFLTGKAPLSTINVSQTCILVKQASKVQENLVSVPMNRI